MALIQNINVSTPNDNLGDTLRDAFVIQNANNVELNDKKVEVEAGKGLSENDFTDSDKTKLDGIEEGAQVNVIPNWAQEDPEAPDYILNKPEEFSITLFIYDGIVDTTAGFVNGQTLFTLPTVDAVVQRVYLNGYPIWKTTDNNASLVGRWSQTGGSFTLTEAVATGDYIYAEYI